MQNCRRYLSICLIAFLIPLLPVKAKIKDVSGFPGWPTQFEGKSLKRLPLTKRESGFYRDFPGKVARFSDGSREIILRWVTSSTRKLHPAADCFKGVGFDIKPQPVEIDKTKNRWGSFIASKGDKKMQVRERIYDSSEKSSGNNWTDVSSWYWSTLLDSSDGPWWVVTVASRVDAKEDS